MSGGVLIPSGLDSIEGMTCGLAVSRNRPRVDCYQVYLVCAFFIVFRRMVCIPRQREIDRRRVTVLPVWTARIDYLEPSETSQTGDEHQDHLTRMPTGDR